MPQRQLIRGEAGALGVPRAPRTRGLAAQQLAPSWPWFVHRSSAGDDVHTGIGHVREREGRWSEARAGIGRTSSFFSPRIGPFISKFCEKKIISLWN